MPQVEEILADRWALVEKIDEGAMGEIFAARHAVLGHPVAVKVLIPTVSRDKAAIDRFLREARIAAKLQHPNVVRVEDFGVAADGRPFLVMELLRGESLARRLVRAPRLSRDEALDVVRQIAAAIDAAHAAGIVHRDLKPENVFLASERGAVVVKVLDFGVAKFTDMLSNGAHATASNTLVGTPRYMSPEQARSLRELDGRSDVWSLGMISYEMLTGSHPFEGEAIAELLVAILTHRIPPLTSIQPDLPAALDVWVLRALARSRYDRFSTGRELADALADALADKVDERWAGFASERARDAANRSGSPRARRSTPVMDVARVRSATPDLSGEPTATPLKLTPPEGPAPVKIPVPMAEPVAHVDVPVGQPAVAVPSHTPATRASWWVAAAAALIAGLGLVLAIRSIGSSRDVVRPARPAVTYEAPRAPGVSLPEAVAPVGAPSVSAPGPGAVTPDVAPERERPRRPLSSRRAHRHGRGAAQHAPPAQNASAQGGGVYDPPGI